MGTGGRIFFTFCDHKDACDLWFSDGSPAGTRRMTQFPAPSLYGPGTRDFVAAGSGLFMSRCIDGTCELSHSDGSSDGTWLLAFPQDYGQDTVRHLVPAGDGVFFTGCDDAGCEPWHSDGTRTGTLRLADIDPGAGDGLPEPEDESPEFAVLDGAFYFLAHEPNTGVELWRSDGSAAGTWQLKDINPGPANGFINRYDWIDSYRAVFTVIGHTLYFVASDGVHGFELWRTDGTRDGTAMVADAIPGSAGVFDYFSTPCDCDANPTNRVAVGNSLWFVTCKWDDAGEPSDTWQLWQSDGTTTGTAQIADGIDARFLSAHGDGVLFAWYDSVTTETAFGRGSATAVDRIATLPGPIDGWTPFSDGVIFAPTSADIGTEPWWSDGTGAGTYLLRDIGGQDASASPTDLIALGDVLLFTGDDGVHGRELWRSDATDAGTVLVADIRPGAAGSGPAHPIQLGAAVLFTADDGVHGSELWRSDGTAAGTQLVADIQPGPGSSAPDRFIVVGDRLFFYADDGVHGRELWRSDGTAAGTALVRDIRPGRESSVGAEDYGARAALHRRLYFSANDGVYGFAFWQSDGTMDGTVPVLELRHRNEDDLFDLFAAAGRLYFSESFTEWETDGTADGSSRIESLSELYSPVSAGGFTYALGEGDQAMGNVWRLNSDDTWSSVDTGGLARLFAVGDQLCGLGGWRNGLWCLGSGFQQPDYDLDQWVEFSDYAVADRRILLYDDYYNALWATDGTAAGTNPLQYLPAPDRLRSDSGAGRTFSTAFTTAGDHIFFAATSGGVGDELWALPISALPELCIGDCTQGPTPVDTDTPTPSTDTPTCTDTPTPPALTPPSTFANTPTPPARTPSSTSTWTPTSVPPPTLTPRVPRRDGDGCQIESGSSSAGSAVLLWLALVGLGSPLARRARVYMMWTWRKLRLPAR